MSLVQGKLLTKNKQKINKGMFFRVYPGWSLKLVAQNYLFISISFYLFIAILCVKMSPVNKA